MKWEVKKLGEVCELITRGIAPKYLDNGGICVINQKCIRDHDINYQLSRRHNLDAKSVPTERFIRVGDVLINSTGTGTLGRIAQVREEPKEKTTVDTHVTIARPIPGKFYLDFFGYMLVKIENEIAQSGEGASGQTELSRKKVANSFYVTFPDSLEEQKWIVEILDESFAGIERAEAIARQNLTNARELFDSYLRKYFESHSESVVFKPINDVVLLARGHNPPKSTFINKPQEGYVRFYQIRDGHNDDYAVYVPDTSKLHKVKPHEILMVAYRHIGRCFRGADGAFNVALCKLTTKDEKILKNDYLFRLIPSKFIRGELMKKSERSLIPSMSIKDLEKLQIPVPSYPEQEKFCKSLDEIESYVEKLEEIYQRKIEALGELKQSILQKAFSGQLTQ